MLNPNCYAGFSAEELTKICNVLVSVSNDLINIRDMIDAEYDGFAGDWYQPLTNCAQKIYETAQYIGEID